MEVMANGDIYINGIGGYDGINFETATTLQNFINNLKSEISVIIQEKIQESL